MRKEVLSLNQYKTNVYKGCDLMKKSTRLLIITSLLIVVVSVSLSNTTSEKASFSQALKFVEDGKLKSAVKTIESLLPKVRSNTMRNQALYVLGNCLRKQGKWDSAIKYYKQAVFNGYVLSDIIKYHIANCYLKKKDYQNAVIWYTKFLNEHKNLVNSASARYQLGKCYLELKEYSTALDTFNHLIASKDKKYLRLATYQSGKAYEGIGQWRSAYCAYQKVIDDNTSDYLARDALEKIENLGKKRKLRITRHQRLTHGMVLYNARKHTSARKQFRGVAAGHKDALAGEAVYYTGRSYYRQRIYDSAIKEYRNITKNYPSSGYLTRALFQTALCYKRKGEITRALQRLEYFANKYSWSALADDALYEVASYQESQKQYADAIKTYKKLTSRYSKSRLADDALWHAGWCHHKLRQYLDSIANFQILINRFPQSRLASAAQYWIGKNYESLLTWKKASAIYYKIVRDNHRYYSNKAKERLQWLVQNQKVSKEVVLPEAKEPPMQAAGLAYCLGESAFQHHPRARIAENNTLWHSLGRLDSPRIQELMYLKAFEDAIVELESLLQTRQFDLSHIYYNMITCYQKSDEFYQVYRYAWKLSQLPKLKDENDALPIEIYKLLYPLHFQDVIYKYSKKYNVDPFFVASMIREESKYNRTIISHAGARGLMQIMPATGKDLARKLKMRRFNTNMLFIPDVNIHIGTRYMGDLMKQFDNNHAFVTGAYNGGPGRMERWMKELDSSDLDEFIEDIPIDETRWHIKKVLDSYHIYKELYTS